MCETRAVAKTPSAAQHAETIVRAALRAMAPDATDLEGLAVTVRYEDKRSAIGQAEQPGGPAAWIGTAQVTLTVAHDPLQSIALDERVQLGAPSFAERRWRERWNACSALAQELAPNSGDETRMDEAWRAARDAGLLQAPSLMLTRLLRDPKLRALKPIKLAGEGKRRFPAVRSEATGTLVAFDPETRMPVLMRQTVRHPLRGPMTLEARYTRWRFDAAIAVPETWALFLGGAVISEATLDDVQVARHTPSGPPNCAVQRPPRADVDELRLALLEGTVGVAPSDEFTAFALAPGVTRFIGRRGEALALQMDNGLVLGDTPCANSCAAALQHALRRRFPSGKLRYLLYSHHHDERLLGFKTFAPLADSVVASAPMRPLLLGLLQRWPKRSPKPTLLDVAPQRVLTDGASRIHLQQVHDHPHASTLLRAFIEKAALVWAVDAAVATDHPLYGQSLDHLGEWVRKLHAPSATNVIDGTGEEPRELRAWTTKASPSR